MLGLLLLICWIVLRSIRDADPSNWPPSRRFIYSKKTSNSSLRPHLEKYHVDQYIRLANERGWKIMLPGLLSQAKSQSAAPVSANKDEQPVQFDEHLFHKYLVNFIVADDQVCFYFIWSWCSPFILCIQSLNVIECPEFRALLILLRNDLQAKIPHRTKLRELVVDAWRQYFQELKADLKVTTYTMLIHITYIRLHVESRWQNFIHDRYLVGYESDTISGDHSTLDCKRWDLALADENSANCIPSDSWRPWW